MTLTPTILTADDLAARAQADIASMPVTRIETHVPHGADRIASRLHPRRDHFRLPEPSLAGISRAGSRHSRAASTRLHGPVSGGFTYTGMRPVTTYHGIDREYRLVPRFESGESPTPVLPATRGGRRRETRVAALLAEADNLMGGAELDMRLARGPGVSAEHRAEILERARTSFRSAERCLHRAEALARAGRVSPELRAQLGEARLRADTAEFGMRA